MFFDYINLLFYFFVFLTSVYIIKYLSKKRTFIDNDLKKKQAIHFSNIPRSGGLLIFFVITIAIIFNYIYLKQNYFHFLPIIILIFILGLIDDYGVKLNPLLRFLILFFISFIYLTTFEYKLRTTGIGILDILLFKYNLEFLIITICFLILINGSNFIDGINGNLTLHFIIILIYLFYCSYNSLDNFNNLIIPLILALFPFLIFNFKNKIFLGDGGAYLSGLIIGILVVEIMYLKPKISPFYFLILTFYLGSEVLISFFRRLWKKKSIVTADFNHLHSLLYSLIKKNKKLDAHLISSLTINLSFFCLVFPSIFFMNNLEMTKIYVFVLYCVYIFAYFFLKSISKKF